MKPFTIYLLVICSLALTGCNENIQISRTLENQPEIFPDYKDVTIPPNIAPLNFRLMTPAEDAILLISGKSFDKTIKQKKGQFTIPSSYWKELLAENQGGNIHLAVCFKENNEWIEYLPFTINIAKEPIDPYIAYRLIEPGYEIWGKMGIYQRNLESYDQTPIIENKMTQNNCVNCHSFPNQDPDKMLFHMRAALAGTYLIDGKKIEKLNTKTDQTISALVYPSWHPSEKYIAFSVNDTRQGFHTRDRNTVEVYDTKSDVVIYDVQKQEIFTVPQLFSETAFESFPTFSADGHTLYFCTSDTCNMPEEFAKVKYSLCSISFDPETRKFGTQVDTLFNARMEDGSASFPRVSPNGKYLLYGRGDYGGFFIWHKEADLYMTDLTTGTHYPLNNANSNDAESYHSWSSNSRWICFASRRMDGLYSRVYFAYIDEKGQAAKAFLMPQKKADFYNDFNKSYNVPELIKSKVKTTGYPIAEEAKKQPGINIKSNI